MAKRRPQGDGMVRKRSDGRWEARIVIGHKNDGTPMHKSVFGKTQKETLDKLHRAIETYRDVDLCEDSRMTLGEWLDKWLDEYMIFTLRESTMQSYRMIVNHYIKPYLGKKPLTSLTTADIQKLYNKLKKEGRVREDPIKGKTLADSMVRGIHNLTKITITHKSNEILLATKKRHRGKLSAMAFFSCPAALFFRNAPKKDPIKPKKQKIRTTILSK